jgi:hypothetical protein
LGETFFSYARADREWVKGLVQIVERAGFSAWFDEEIMPGEQFDSVVEAAIAKATKVVVIWSNASIGSRWVKAEAGEGLDRGILVPVLKEPVQIPLEFRRVQAADLSDWSGEEGHKELKKLIAALNPRGREIGSPGKEEAADAANPQRVSAELLSADRYLSNAKIRLIVGRSVYVIEHLNKVRFQTVCVNGTEVGRGGSLTEGHDYFQFYIEHDGEQLFAELRPRVSVWTGMREIRLLLQEKEVLAENISFGHGWVKAVMLSLLGALGFALLIYLLG